MKTLAVWCAVILTFVLLGPQATHALPIEIAYSGSGQIYDPGNLVGGSTGLIPFSGTFRYDNSASLRYEFDYPQPDPGDLAVYDMSAPVGSLSVSMGGIYVESDASAPLDLVVQNLLPTNPSNRTDAVDLRTNAFTSSVAAVAPSSFNYFTVSFLDDTGAIFPTNAISDLFDFSAFTHAFLHLQVRDPNDPNVVLWQMSGAVLDAAVTVPEPGTLALLGDGLLTMLVLASRKARDVLGPSAPCSC